MDKKIAIQLGSHDHDLRNIMPDYEVINIDAKKYPCVDIVMDLKDKIPYPDESVDVIFSEHFLEHFAIHEMDKMAADWYRLLKKGGELIAVIPDGGVYLKQYLDSEDIPHSNTVICIFRYDEEYQRHKFVWTEKLLIKYFTKIGFQSVKVNHENPDSTIPLMCMRAYK